MKEMAPLFVRAPETNFYELCSEIKAENNL
jgi:hypothetical protein